VAHHDLAVEEPIMTLRAIPAEDKRQIPLMKSVVAPAVSASAARTMDVPLSLCEVATRIGERPGWRLVAKGRAIERSFEFRAYDAVARFVIFVVSLAALASAYPDLRVEGDRVTVRLGPRDSGGWRGPALDLAAVLDRFARVVAGAAAVREDAGTDEEGPEREEEGMTTVEVKNDPLPRLEQLAWRVDEIDREMREILDSLPVVGEEAAEEMEEGSRPQSLAHHVRATIECLLVDRA
jgi:pterin-4a-carbinolamine dehydratase